MRISVETPMKGDQTKTKNTRTRRHELLKRLRFKNKIFGNYPTGISPIQEKNVLTHTYIRKKHTRAKSATKVTRQQQYG